MNKNIILSYKYEENVVTQLKQATRPKSWLNSLDSGSSRRHGSHGTARH